MIRLGLPLLLSVLLTGCATGRNCNMLTGEVERLRCEASTGDKQAQLALGIRYETGDGVARDLDRAEQLYARAARTEARPRYVYSPPVGKEGQGRVIPVSSAGVRPGLPEAARRLDALRREREAASPSRTSASAMKNGFPKVAPACGQRTGVDCTDPSGIMRSLLSRLEINGWTLSVAEIAAIFGEDVLTLAPTPSFRAAVAPDDSADHPQRLYYFYSWVPCPAAGHGNEECSRTAVRSRLDVLPDYQDVQRAVDEAGDPTRLQECITNDALVERLRSAGWLLLRGSVEPADYRIIGEPPPSSELRRLGTRLVVEPSLSQGTRCIFMMSIRQE
jgi:hypothetical protein